MTVDKKILMGILLAVLIQILVPSKLIYAQNTDPEIEDLKKQIIEIQIQNERMIHEIEKKNQEQIEKLNSKIEALESQRKLDQKNIEELKSKNVTYSDNLNKIIDNKLESYDKYIPIFKFNTDFPSYFRVRGRVFNDATYISVVENKDDDIFFADSRLLISPMIEINDNLSLRSQLDIAKNIVWGGLGDETIANNFTQAPSPSDTYRGALLRDVTDTFSGEVLKPVDENTDYFNIRSLYFVAKTPVGELWVGRQPYDWGLGILNNAGSMPDQDFGSIVDRFEFDTSPFSLINEKLNNWILAFSIDRLRQGNTIANSADGKGWEVGVGTLYQGKNYELGSYVFLLNQNGFDLSGGLTGDLNNTINWSVYGKYNPEPFYASFEFQELVGEVNNLEQPLPSIINSDSIDISSGNIMLAARIGYNPKPYFIDYLMLEFGLSSGDNTLTPNKLEGNAIFFNNAYTVDNLLFKHVIPNIYAIEGSVINSGYTRAWSTFKLSNSISFTPQVLFAWVDQKNALSLDVVTPLPSVNKYLGAELEGTITYKIMDHLWFDMIGSFIIAGNGLNDLMSQRAFIEGAIDNIYDAKPPDYPFSVQGRFIFTLDSIIKSWTGNSTLKQRAWFNPHANSL